MEVKLLINEIVYQFYRVRQIFERLSSIDADQLDDILNGMVYEKLINTKLRDELAVLPYITYRIRDTREVYTGSGIFESTPDKLKG